MENNQRNVGMSEAALMRSHIYGFLSLIFYREADVHLLRLMKEPPFPDVMKDLGVHLDDRFFMLPEEALAEELAVEYARLFLGPGTHISPHESVFNPGKKEKGLLWGEATAAVKKFIESSGVEYNPDYRGMPDHISVELEFMQAATFQENRAIQNNDPDTALLCRNIEYKFMKEHIVQWVPDFCLRVSGEAKLPFYRQMATLTHDFIHCDWEEIECRRATA